MRKFICPICNEDHEEQFMEAHFKGFHEMDNPPTTFDEYEARYAVLGVARIVGEDDDELQ